MLHQYKQTLQKTEGAIKN